MREGGCSDDEGQGKPTSVEYEGVHGLLPVRLGLSDWTLPWVRAKKYRFPSVVQRFKGFRFKALQAYLPSLL